MNRPSPNAIPFLSLLLLLPLAGCKKDDPDLFYKLIPYIESVRFYGSADAPGYHDNYATIDTEALKELLPRAKYKKGTPFRKGSYWARASLKDGTDLFLRISMYGAFFEVDGMKGYFYFGGSVLSDGTRVGDKKTWLDLKDVAVRELEEAPIQSGLPSGYLAEIRNLND